MIYATDVNRDLSRLYDIITVLRELDETLPIQMAHVLLCVAAKPGITMVELRQQVGLSQPACLRNTQTLSGKLGLIDSAPDPRESRRMVFFLTEQGRRRLTKLFQALHPGEIVDEFPTDSLRPRHV